MSLIPSGVGGVGVSRFLTGGGGVGAIETIDDGGGVAGGVVLAA